jgi:hypothetical protein
MDIGQIENQFRAAAGLPKLYDSPTTTLENTLFV